MLARRFASLSLFLAVLVLGIIASSQPTVAGNDVFTVDSEADAVDADLNDPACQTAAQECTLRAAVMQANVDDGPETINIPDGLYTLSIAVAAETDPAENGDLDVLTDLTIIGGGSTQPVGTAGASATIIDANDIDRLFHVRAGNSVTLEGMVLRNGDSRNSTDTMDGGAILAGTDSPVGATVSLDDVVVEDNHGGDVGGGVVVTGILNATDSLFQRNEAVGEGGGIVYITPADLALRMTIENSTIADNIAPHYAGLEIAGETTLDGVTVSGNQATLSGAGMGVFAATTIVDSTIRENDVTTATSDNGHGGGIYALDAEMTITDSLFEGNTAAGRGGAMMVLETNAGASLISMDNITFEGNEAKLGGGAIRMGLGDIGAGAMTITNSTFSHNSADGSGGAIYNFGPATSILNLFNVTISNNETGGFGGGIRTIGEDASTSLTHSTVSENRANADGDLEGDGGGLNQDQDSVVTLRNSILYNNRSSAQDDSDNCSGTITATAENIVGNTTGCTLVGGTFVAGDPLLGDLGANGGLTQTHALLPGSVAIDEVEDCPPPATDQRGVTRPQGPACDLGSFEVETATPTPTASPTSSPSPTPGSGDEHIWGDVDCDGALTTRDNQAELRFVLEQNALSQTEPCPDIGSTVSADGTFRVWGDEDCDSSVTTRDNQSKLRFVLQQNALSQTEPCPDVGSRVVVSTFG